MIKFNFTDKIISKIYLDIFDEWQYDKGLCDVGIEGIENEVRDYFNITCEEYPDSYVYTYVYIDPKDKIVKKIWISVVAGDDVHDKNEMLYISKKKGKDIYKRLLNSDKNISNELEIWIDECIKEG